MRRARDSIAGHRLAEVVEAISRHQRQKGASLSLLPTENLLSPLASIALSTDLVNRYLLLDSSLWEYPQNAILREIQGQCEETIRRLFGVKSVNVRPLSGLSAMTVVLAGLTQTGDALFTLDPQHGGHGATAKVARRLGLRTEFVPFDLARLELDLDRCGQLFSSSSPRLIYLDHSNVLFPLDVQSLAKIVPDNCLVYYDVSQIFGLMLSPGYFNPLKLGLPVVGGSTHKTFPGPQKGMILSNDESLAGALQAASDVFVSSHHVNSVSALWVTAIEMDLWGADFAERVIDNARTLANALLSQGLPVQGRGSELTGSHQIWLDVSRRGRSASDEVALLNELNIVVNLARIPTTESGVGLRMGVTELSRLGMGASELSRIAELVAAGLLGRRSADSIRQEVADIRNAFQRPRFCFSGDSLSDFANRLCPWLQA